VRIDDVVPAPSRRRLHAERRAWKGFDRGALERRQRQGLIGDPVGKAKSVVLTDEGLARSAALLETLFAKMPSGE